MLSFRYAPHDEINQREKERESTFYSILIGRAAMAIKVSLVFYLVQQREFLLLLPEIGIMISEILFHCVHT